MLERPARAGRPRRAGIRMAVLAGAVAAAAGVVSVTGVPDADRIAALTAGWGPFGPIAMIVLAAVLMVALVPRSALAAGAGLAFGPWQGSLYVLGGAAVAALVAFAAGRMLGRDFVAARARLSAVDSWLSARGAFGVALLRLLPVAPFGLVSYGYGTTGIRVGSYLAGTAMGAAPATVVYAGLGASATEPGSPAFLLAVVAAVTLAVGGAVASAILRRRRVAARPAES
ncbi:TVP38/TMEM64 family protein [Actinoplanes subglobosus]|uniref:TVP38/TMEM64 family membrane protein n=1 Tax=Actinoplanes subglobosus TaxID=1547892 RepID=A0ABV8IXV8_9ACTN